MDARYELPSSFYLGKKYDLDNRQLLDDLVCYDAKDLTTHAMCVGMTGSGKTGLCLAMLEEAAIDGIPAICIDPKGDLGNLLLTFPEFQPEQFLPWLDQAEATRKGISLEELAVQTAEKWRGGLAQWEQLPERVARFRDSVDIAIYTPGSNAGLPMTVLRSFDAPPEEVREDSELLRERIAGAASGLLTLLGIDADPLNSREHILLSNIFSQVWNKGEHLALGSLIRLIQNPPLTKIGVLDLESFYPSSERMKLAMSLNNLLASPSFAGWLEGQPLDIQSLLYTPQGKPRLSILSIAHLSDTERMFFVTIFLNELLSWMRMQPGTSSLRALFYMDEVYGYFPPSAKPPSKPPMLVLLKQARAFGLGIALATQNPVDLDYKGLANIGTWFLGRLQTERDKARVLEGLEGAAQQAGAKFDRGAMERTLAALGSRVFLMNNVHDDRPTIFQSRWALSFLRGPLARQDIQKLMAPRKQAVVGVEGTRASHSPPSSPGSAAPPTTSSPPAVHTCTNTRPMLVKDIDERFIEPTRTPGRQDQLQYRPALLAQAASHYVRATVGVDTWIDMAWLTGREGQMADDVWANAQMFQPRELELSRLPALEDAVFEEPPAPMLAARNYRLWANQLKDYVYRHQSLRIYECLELKAYSNPGEDELEARLGMERKLRETRDAEKDKLRAKYDTLLRSLENKIATAQQRVAKESSEFMGSAIDVISGTVLGMLLGNKRSRATTTTRGIGKAAQKSTQSQNAKRELERLQSERSELVEQAESDIERLKDRFSIHRLTLQAVDIPCRKSDTRIDLVALVWVPYAVDARGEATPLVKLSGSPSV